MNENINQLNENFETYQEILKNDMDYQNNNITSSNEQTKCYCGHTDYCDCGTLEEPKQETPKTFKELFANTGIKPTTDANGIVHYNFKATLKDEPKQETLEEVAKKIYGSEELKDVEYYAFINGAKWQQEQDKKRYSEEEVETIARDAYSMGRNNILIGVFNKWFEQFKKK